MFYNSLATRQCAPEWMDARDVKPELIDNSLRFIRRVNTLLGYTRATLSHLQRFSCNWKPDETITVLDVATGSADIPRAVAHWAAQHGFKVKIIGLDRHELTLGIARDLSRPNNSIGFIRGDALHIPLADASVDYVITNMFLHHLEDDGIVQVMREMGRVARRGVIAADLLRHKRAYFWISLLTLASNSMIKHDAKLSVAQAMNKQEAISLRDRAGIGFAQYHRHFGHRFVLAGEKPGHTQI
ncbi:MAG TPA: methyltransferase domain-containing protein [Tepidisphaeraceae bacterium]|nr:methyltransferase domain-containing protein [Tepidisphaeraceae bacterium]